MTTPRHFGTLADGTDILAIDLVGGGLAATVLTWGATLQDLRLSGHDAPLVLGFDSLNAYLDHGAYFGAVPGRYANRIAHARFTLDGQSHQLDVNERTHTLHGGWDGAGTRPWTLVDRGADFVTLAIELADGHMGFPGTLAARCTYRLDADGVLDFSVEAETDKATPCNFTQHAYFNLDDGGRTHVRGHGLKVLSNRYLPTDDEDIPVGGTAPVAGTPYDFRDAHPIERIEDGAPFGYDVTYCFGQDRKQVVPMAEVTAARSGIVLDVASTEPGLQFYTAHKLEPGAKGLTGEPYAPFAGFCLEPQTWPDSPNHPDYPSSILRPGETYRHRTVYRFTRS